MLRKLRRREFHGPAFPLPQKFECLIEFYRSEVLNLLSTRPRTRRGAGRRGRRGEIKMRKIRLAAAIYFSGCDDGGASGRGTLRPAVTIGPRPGPRGVPPSMSMVGSFLLNMQRPQPRWRIVCSACVSGIVVSLSTVAPFIFYNPPENYTAEELMSIGLIACLMFAVTFYNIFAAMGY